MEYFSEEKLKTKALAQKVKLLEDEIEKLTEQLCTRAMGAADDEEMVETCRLLEIRLHEVYSPFLDINNEKHAF